MVRLLAPLATGFAALLLLAAAAHTQEAPAPEPKDWLYSDQMLARAIDSIGENAKLDREHDIPYLAGYSEDGKIIYIDRHLPKGFDYQGRFVEVDRFLTLHEAVEKALISTFGLRYQFAHQVALRAEMAAVAAAKVEWSAYDGFMQQWIKKIGEEPIESVPADLDLTPYRDENDTETIEQMRRAMGKGGATAGKPGEAATGQDKLPKGRH